MIGVIDYWLQMLPATGNKEPEAASATSGSVPPCLVGLPGSTHRGLAWLEATVQLNEELDS